jgi:hypothetical protein
MIETFDNFLDETELKKAVNITSNLKWELNGASSDEKDGLFWSAGLMHNNFFSEHIFKKIEKTLKKDLKLWDVYANGQTYGQDGGFHIDTDADDYYTFIMYMSDIRPENVDVIGGYTEFKFKNGVHAIEPLLNRCVLFDSKLLHRGLAPSRSSRILRISVAFKIQIKDTII